MPTITSKNPGDLITSSDFNNVLGKIQNGVSWNDRTTYISQASSISGYRVGGLRYATEFDTAKHAGTVSDMFTLASIKTALADLPTQGGKVLCPSVYFGSSESTVTIAKHGQQIEGMGCYVIPVAGNNWWLFGGQNGIQGTVLVQKQVSTDCLLIKNGDGTGNPLEGVIVRDIGLTFGNCPNNTPQNAGIATGHALDILPPSSGANIRNSIVGSVIDNVVAYGHDGNHYGFNYFGINQSSFGQHTSWGGGGLHLQNPDGNSTFYGNMILYTHNIGNAHACWLDGNGGIGNALNIISFVYVQGYIDLGPTNPVSSQNAFKANNLGGQNTIFVLDEEVARGQVTLENIDSVSQLIILDKNGGGTLLAKTGMGVWQNGATLSNAAYGIAIGSGSGIGAQLWYRDMRGKSTLVPNSFGTNMGLKTAPISLAAASGIAGFNGGVALARNYAFLRVPSTAFTANTPVTFYAYSSMLTGTNYGSDFYHELFVNNGGDLGAILGFMDNSGTVGQEIKITVYPLRTATFFIDFMLEIIN